VSTDYVFIIRTQCFYWSQLSRGLRRRSAAARLLVFRARIPLGAWISVCCDCCVLLGKGLCDVLITCPEESYRVWCVWVWSWILDNEKALAHWGAVPSGEKNTKFITKLPQVKNLETLSDNTLRYRSEISRAAFLKLWSADHKWSSGPALVVLLDW